MRYAFVSEKWWWSKNFSPFRAERGDGYIEIVLRSLHAQISIPGDV